MLAPKLWDGMRVGLLGGSFNPPHPGHVHASKVALGYLGLDAVWWLVAPSNPLKSGADIPDLARRTAQAAELVRHPKIFVCALEHETRTIRSFDSVRALQKSFPRVDFIWLAGTDIAYEIHRWQNWRRLAKIIPFAFIGRPTRHGVVRCNALRMLHSLCHLIPSRGTHPDLRPGRIFWLFHEPRQNISSTEIRARSARP